LLAGFASAVDAVQGAVAIQEALKSRNAELPLNRRMEFRIGVNVGDVVVEGDHIYGDGVNIAARVEALAEGGGICLSGTVYDQVKNKLAFTYGYLGEQEVKNIAEPVRVYRLRADEVARRQVASPKPGKAGNARRKWPLAAATGLFLLAAITVAVRYFPFPVPGAQHPAPDTQSPTPNPQTLPLPDKPSIVVLPFVNISGDPEQEYFSDGMTEDLITNLSKFSGLFVIARNSAFTYKGKAVKVQDVSREMGVQYVLEGSVRKADSQVRISAQLVDALRGVHLWAESYDRQLKDIFALQDEIRQQVVTALQLKVAEAEIERAKRTPTHNLTAYDYLLRGHEHYGRFTKEAHDRARQLYDQAIAVDPQYAEAYVQLGWSYWLEWALQWSADPQSIERALALAQKAITLNSSLASAHTLLGAVHLWKDRQYERAIAESQQALTLDPNCGGCYAVHGQILSYAGWPQEAVGLIEKGMRLDPCCTVAFAVFLAEAYLFMERYEEAIAPAKQMLAQYPHHPTPHLILATSYSALGQDEKARAETAEVLQIDPSFSLEMFGQTRPMKDHALLERLLAFLRQAGLK
jgi:adenylate cyclase